MKALRAVAREVWGLFVDDGSLALAVLAWLVLVGAAAHRPGADPRLLALLLVGGLLAILVESAWRAAGRVRR